MKKRQAEVLRSLPSAKRQRFQPRRMPAQIHHDIQVDVAPVDVKDSIPFGGFTMHDENVENVPHVKEEDQSDDDIEILSAPPRKVKRRLSSEPPLVLSPPAARRGHRDTTPPRPRPKALVPKGVKKEKEDIKLGILFPPTVLDPRLEGTSDFIIPDGADGVDTLGFTREFLSGTYGGDRFKMLSRIGDDEKLAIHNILYWAYLPFHMHPCLPLRAGQPGICLDNEHAEEVVDDSEHPEPRLLFCGHKPNDWRMKGMYKFSRAAPLSIDEWKALPIEVKTMWVSKILKKSWGLPVRVAVELRKVKRRPSKLTEVQDALADIKKKERAEPTGVTKEEIWEEFDLGNQRIFPSVMQCVDFDVAFYNKAVAASKKFAPKPTKEMETKKKKS